VAVNSFVCRHAIVDCRAHPSRHFNFIFRHSSQFSSLFRPSTTDSTMTDQPTAQTLLASFQTYGWIPDPTLFDDVNFLDLVLLITRSSKLRQGSMACILVRPATATTAEQAHADRLIASIVAISNNLSFYKEGDSDIHAEIAVLGQMARAGRSTDQCTAYITMPPCKRCLVALYSAGIKRIVLRLSVSEHLASICVQHGIEMVTLPQPARDEQRIRVDALVQAYSQEQETWSVQKKHPLTRTQGEDIITANDLSTFKAARLTD
jgi:tRNA(Arg) A34 adenosine deaminase TadA